MPSGYTPNLPADVLLDTGVLYVNGVAVGASNGGLKFDPAVTFRQVQYDGQRAPVQGLDRIVSWASNISGKLIQFSSGTLNQFIECGSAIVTGSGAITNVIIPQSASVLIPASEYINNLALKFQRGNGLFVQVRFSSSLCTKWDLSGQDKNEAQVSVTFEARQVISGTNTTDTAPYVIEYSTT